jgi:5-methylthioribose kinase
VVDIADKEALLGYLAGKRVFPGAGNLYVRYFSGGVSGTVALVADAEKSVIVKQALPALKVAETWECDPDRMIIEHRALEVYARLVPDCVPAPLFYDDKNRVMCREAAPEACSMWKTHLLEGLLDFRVAKKAIETLRAVHHRTASDAGLRDTFRRTDIFYSLRVNPYIEFTVKKHPDLKPLSEPVIEMLMNEKIALVHGDYSPKNILVSGEKIFILDMEVAHFGHPSFDIAFFSTHFLLKSVKRKDWQDAYLSMLRYMTNIYFRGVTRVDAKDLERAAVGILGFLFLARVDGKSPAEYLTGDSDKALVRTIALRILKDRLASFGEVIALVKKECGQG